MKDGQGVLVKRAPDRGLLHKHFLYWYLLPFSVASWITKKSMFLSCLEQCPTYAIADHGGAHKLCVMELVKGTDEMTMTVEQRWEFTLFCQFLKIYKIKAEEKNHALFKRREK